MQTCAGSYWEEMRSVLRPASRLCASSNGQLGRSGVRSARVSEAPRSDCVACQTPQQVSRSPQGSAPDFRRTHQGGAIAEAVMSTITYPPKDLVRAYLAQRLRERRPPPTPEEIRHRLGWTMLFPELKFAANSRHK